MSDYRPISCDMHSQLELLAMRRTPCRLQLSDTDAAVEGIIADFTILDQAEFLILESGEMIRLDRIISASAVMQATH